VKQCLIFWNGVPSEGGASFTLQHGVNPSRGILRFRLNVTLQQFGTLTITDGTSTVNVTGCRVVRRVLSSSGRGRHWELTIEDSRWRWSENHAPVWGQFNVQNTAGIEYWSKKNAFDIGTMLFDALGETGYDCSALSTDDYPEFNWSAEPAAGALEQLASLYGLTVVPMFNGRFRLLPIGVGSMPPNDDRAMDFQNADEPKTIPDALVFEGGPTRWQQELILEPVGFESFQFQNVVKPIDQLSYTPATGWSKEDPKTFNGVSAEKRELAKACIWRMYRVKTPIVLKVPPAAIQNGTKKGRLGSQQYQQLQSYFTISSSSDMWRILPLLGEQTAGAMSALTYEPPDHLVFGYFANQKHGTTNNDSDANIAAATANFNDPAYQYFLSSPEKYVYQGDFYVDTRNAVVKFSRPVYLWTRAGGTNTARTSAMLRLRTAVCLRDPDTHAFVSQQVWFPLTNSSRQGVASIVKRDDVYYWVAPDASYAGGDNAASFTASAMVSINAEANKYRNDPALSIPYKGFVFDVQLSGAIMSIEWRVSDRGDGTTSIDYLTERPDLRLTSQQLNRQTYVLSNAISQAKAAKIAARNARAGQRKVK